MKRVIGILVAIIVVAALGFAGWLYLGRNPLAFAGGATVALADYHDGTVAGVPADVGSVASIPGDAGRTADD